MMFPGVRHANTQIEMHKYTNTAWVKVPEGAKSWEKEGQYHKGNLNGFKMGPIVKFVLAIIC